MTLSEGLGRYAAYLAEERAPNSQRAFATLAAAALAALGDRALNEISPEDVDRFLRRRWRKASTRSMRLAQLRACVRWLCASEERARRIPPADPTVRLAYRRPKPTRRPGLTEGQIEAWLRTIADPGLALALALMSRCALRAEEVRRLGARDLCPETHALRLRNPKSGAAAEYVPVPDVLWDILMLHARSVDDRLFPLSYDTLYAACKRGGLTPHDLRRFAITRALERGAPLHLVSRELARHRSLATTERYILGSLSPDQLRQWL